MSLTLRLVSSFCFLTLSTAALAQTEAKIPERGDVDFDKVVQSLNLSDSERVFKGKTGCSYIFEPENPKPDKVLEGMIDWEGSCPYGLANGMGFLIKADGSKYAKQTWMGRESLYELTYGGGKIKSFDTTKSVGGTELTLSDVNLSLQSYGNGIGDQWIGAIKFKTLVDKSSELLGRDRISCAALPKIAPQHWVQDGKFAIQTVKEATKDCEKIVKKGKVKRFLRVIEHRQTDTAGAVTMLQYYPCAFDADEAKEAALDNSYCTNHWTQLTAQIRPRVDERIAKSKAQHDDMVARSNTLRLELPAKYQALVLAAREEDRKRKEALAASIAQEVPNRHAKYLGLPDVRAKMSPDFQVPMPFIAPPDTSKVGVIVVGRSSGDQGKWFVGLDFDVSTLQLASQFDVPDLADFPEGAQFDAALEALKKAGAATVYIVDLNRSFIQHDYTKINVLDTTITTNSQTVRNAAYDQLVADLNQARAEEATAEQAKNGADAEAANASVPSGTSAGVAALTGLTIGMKANSANNRYRRARDNRISLEQRLSQTSETQTLTDSAKIKSAWIEYSASLDGRLAIFACTLSSGMCSEKEQIVQDKQSGMSPVVTARLDPNLAQMERGNSDFQKIIDQFSKKSGFGFSGAAIGTFMNGTTQEIPLTTLNKYISFAYDESWARSNELHPSTSKHIAIEEQLRAIGDDYRAKGIAMRDFNAFISMSYENARRRVEKAEEEQRKKNLQTLGN